MNEPVERTPLEDRQMWKRHREILTDLRRAGCSHYFCSESIAFLHDGSERRDDAGEPCAECLRIWERAKGCSEP